MWRCSLKNTRKGRQKTLISPPPRRLPSKKWRDIIMQVWHTDPLRCPVCQNIMRVIAVIDQRVVVEKILRPFCVHPLQPFYSCPTTKTS